MEEIKITLETLYDILRNEKQREDLQQLNSTFFIDVVSYLKEKKKLLGSKQEEDDLFAAGEREKLEYELRSIKRILKEVYEKREKKILDIALNKSRTGSDIIDTGALLREEKEFYDLILDIMDGYRKGILLNLFKGEIPLVQIGKLQVGTLPPKPSIESHTEEVLPPEPINKELLSKAMPAEEKGIQPTDKIPDNHPMKKIKFIHPVPSFVWTDLKDYGPFEEGEETEIFAEVADLIIEKKRAVEV